MYEGHATVPPGPDIYGSMCVILRQASDTVLDNGNTANQPHAVYLLIYMRVACAAH